MKRLAGWLNPPEGAWQRRALSTTAGKFKMKFLLTITVLSMSAPAWAQRGGSPASASSGYLTGADAPDVARVVPPAPSTGDARFVADMTIFHNTRSLEGSKRWELALADDDVSTAGLLHVFRCALGVTLTRENAPKVTTLITRADVDSNAASRRLKELYRHKRPFQVADGEVCLSRVGKAALEESPDYPSGHATAAWETGLILAELAPDAAGALLARARAFGESRVVCGVHNASAVEAGRMTATVIFAVQNDSRAFHADLEAARAELAALRAASKTKPEGCALEAEVLSKSPY
jgi:acid phosphatase (class A)